MNTRMKWFTAVSCAMVALSVCTACQDDDIDNASGTTANMHTYRLTVEATANNDNATGTRSLSEGADNALHSTWEEADKIIAYNLSDNEKSTANQFSLLSNMTLGKSGQFEGQISSVNAISTTDQLCFLYPSPSVLDESETDDDEKANTIQSVKKVTEKVSHEGQVGKEDFIYYAPEQTIKRYVELNLSQQDGTVETIGKKFDFQWGKANPTSVSGNTVKANAGTMKRQIAIWGFQFTDENGAALKDIDAVYISGVKSIDVFDLGEGIFMDDANSGDNDIVLLKPGEGKPKFTSESNKYTYAAMLPGTYEKVLISAYIGNKCYAREYANITLNADKVYRTKVKNMKEVVANPYVEVQGVKWATGNFIHYGEEGSGNDYWGIAPTQWWISQYDMTDPNLGIKTTSQFTKKDIEGDPNDLDLFRFGDIEKATTLKHNNCKAGDAKIDICKRFFKHKGAAGLQQVEMTPSEFENNPELAAWGDIVWFHTRNDNQKYRMPTFDDLTTLYEVANIIPAYCIAPTGKRIYGAFFYTNTTNNSARRKNNFPTGKNTLYKYNDVTALVRANKGLFLPIAGRRRDNATKIGYRNLINGRLAYAQYMSSTVKSLYLSQDFFFGSHEWNLSGNGVTQAKSIRPVWDPKSNSTPNPVYPAFKDLQ